MITGVIDIGSNSVRLALSADGKIIYKLLNTTRLGQDRSADGALSLERIEQTAAAVKDFADRAALDGADVVYAFATAAVRESPNRQVFLSRVLELTGLNVDVLSGETEALAGILGALGSGDGGVIDIGGASSEIAVRRGGKIIYSKSVKAGAVSLFAACGRKKNALERDIEIKIREFGEVPKAHFTCIGGTATTLAAMDLGLNKYDGERVHGHSMTKKALKAMTDKLFDTPIAQLAQIGCVGEKRAEIIAGGGLLLYKILEYTGADDFTVSDSDNTEGYLALKGADKSRL